MNTKYNFEEVLQDLDQIGNQGHEYLTIRKRIPRTKSKASWFHRLVQIIYKPKNARIGFVAKHTLQFFQNNQEKIRDTSLLEQFVPILRKGNYGKELKDLIDQIHQRSRKDLLLQSEESNVQESIPIHSEETGEVTQEEESQLQDTMDTCSTSISIEDVSKFEDIKDTHTCTVLDDMVEEVSKIEEVELEKDSMRTALFTQALEIAEEFENSRDLDNVLAKIVREQVKVDSKGAIETIKKMKVRCNIINKLVGEFAKSDLEDLIEVVKDEHIFEQTMGFIACELVNVDIEKAKDIAREIQDEYWYGFAFENIVMTQDAIKQIEERLA